MIKRLLVGLGGTAFTPTAIRYSIELAQAHHAELRGVTVTDYHRLHALEKSGASRHVAREFRDLEARRQSQEESVTAFEAACATAGIHCDVVRESGDTFEKMISQARYYDLMVFGMRSLFDCNIVKTNDSATLTQLVSQGVRPILAVSEDYHPVRRVLLAYSGSMESAKAFKRFLHMQLWKDLALKVVTFGHPPELAQTLLNDVAGYCRAYGYNPETEHVSGSPKRFLLQHATNWNADLIVLGNSAKQLWIKKLIGETAMHVIRHAEIPLFLSQ